MSNRHCIAVFSFDFSFFKRSYIYLKAFFNQAIKGIEEFSIFKIVSTYNEGFYFCASL